MLTIAISKGRILKETCARLKEELVESRELIQEIGGRRYILTKPVDVPAYVENGAADVGIVGKDIIEESGKDLYEVLDLGYGQCRLMMAVPVGASADIRAYNHRRVATKYPRIAEEFFTSQGMQMEYIKLNGSIELAPLVGLSESIVDIVETGSTLRANGLMEIGQIMRVSARLIVNRVAYKLKFDEITALVRNLRGQ